MFLYFISYNEFVWSTVFSSISGLIVGAIIRYAGTNTTLVHMQVEPQGEPTYNDKLPPDTLWFKVNIGIMTQRDKTIYISFVYISL